MKHWMITGAAGFVGEGLAHHLQRVVDPGEFQHGFEQSLRQERVKRGLYLLPRAFLQVTKEPSIQLLA